MPGKIGALTLAGYPAPNIVDVFLQQLIFHQRCCTEQIAGNLAQGKNVGVFLGNFAVHHPDFAALHALAQDIARLSGGRFGILGEAANSVGGYLAEALPRAGRDPFEPAHRAYLLVNVEPALDCADPDRALRALEHAALVVALSPYQHAADYAHVMLPISPFTETSGTFVNCEGRAQSFNGVVRPLGEARPGWKVLRVLGNLLELPGFDYETSEAVRDKVLGAPGADLSARLANGGSAVAAPTHGSPQAGSRAAPASAATGAGLQRIAEVPMYHADSIVRRAPSLQATADARRSARVTVSGATAVRLGLKDGERARIRRDSGEAVLPVAIDDRLPDDCARIPTALASTAALGPAHGRVTVERA